MRGVVTGMAMLGVGLLAACGGGEPDLITLRADGRGPDEFSILPGKPLQSPPSFSDLPVPTPGGANRTDPTPEADAVVALGGSAAATQGGGVRGPALVAHATRFGVDGDIRRTLAVEDARFRQANDGLLLERLFDLTIYYRAYRPYSLDQYAELDRLRSRGIRTPAVPPEGF